jgi:hypothetical protein
MLSILPLPTLEISKLPFTVSKAMLSGLFSFAGPKILPSIKIASRINTSAANMTIILFLLSLFNIISLYQ